MYPVAYEYVRAASVEHARACLADAEGEGKLLAGGHSLIPMLKLRLAVPEVLVDVSELDELRGIEIAGQQVRIGASTTWRELLMHEGLGSAAPVVPEAVEVIGDRQVRARGTVGGSLAHADAAADIPAPLLVLDAEVEIAGEDGRRWQPLDDVLVAMFQTTLEDDDLLTAIRFAPLPTGAGSAYEKFPQPASHLALCGIAAVVRLDGDTIAEARLAVTGATGRAFRPRDVEQRLVGQQPTDDVFADVATGIVGDRQVRSDIHADATYRANLVEVLTQRALRRATDRATQGTPA